MVDKLSTLIFLLQQLVQLLAQGPTAPIVPLPVNLNVQHSVLDKVPIITRVEPKSGPAETAVTIYGEGFSRERNVIYTGLGQVTVSSPDGKKLSFTLPKSSLFSDEWRANTADYRREHYSNQSINFPLGFYVKNEYGTTIKPGLFSLTI